MIDLSSDEHIIIKNNCSWTVWIPFVLPCLIIDDMLFRLISRNRIGLAIVVFIIGLAIIWKPLNAWAATDLIVTNQRVYGKSGIIKRTILDMPLDKVNTVYISASLFGRFLHYGTIHISTADGQKPHHYVKISNYESMHQEIMQAISCQKINTAKQQAEIIISSAKEQK